ncbi:TRAP transporter substrate-binding protein [Metabacillus halosaccharovorans]|uniref:TRAP transporter substrate-binding protein n=1 Tax=Metabacillus halosaccharovorans TaxID=930124 RepID=UPI00203D2433|nr:TRAP transporter substrate-binding protein [Metabacillus halosaccharovorans]MCM3444212.1 TRAP transporter substrate-binding protein [Metabacillus halosaccharovorans]
MKTLQRLAIIFTIGLALSILVVFLTTSNAVGSNNETIIRFGHGAAESNERHLAVMKFKELVEEKSEGKMKVQVYPNEQLGSEAEMIESVTFNDLQMVAASAFSQYDQRISVFELPYLFDSYEQAWSILDSDIGQQVAKPLLEDGLRVVAYFENGFRHVTSNKPIEEPEDLGGLKIRTPEFPLSISTFKAFGSNPTPMAFGELYMALQQGTVDAQENPIANTYASKFNEIQDYLNLTGHQYMPLPVAISEEFWQTLTPEEQEIIKSSASEAAKFHRDILRENEEEMISELQNAGMTVIQPDRDKFRERAEAVYEAYKNRFGEDFVNNLLKAVEHKQ